MRRLLHFLPLLFCAGCDHGLAPPDEPPTGAIEGIIIYVDPKAWPPRGEVRDLRFVALPFIPRDSTDLFRDLNAIIFSETLDYRVARDTFLINDVPAKAYIYNGVAQQFSTNLLDWRPVGLYEDNGGIIDVRAGETAQIQVLVDFNNLPPFPPPEQSNTWLGR